MKIDKMKQLIKEREGSEKALATLRSSTNPNDHMKIAIWDSSWDITRTIGIDQIPDRMIERIKEAIKEELNSHLTQNANDLEFEAKEMTK